MSPVALAAASAGETRAGPARAEAAGARGAAAAPWGSAWASWLRRGRAPCAAGPWPQGWAGVPGASGPARLCCPMPALGPGSIPPWPEAPRAPGPSCPSPSLSCAQPLLSPLPRQRARNTALSSMFRAEQMHGSSCSTSQGLGYRLVSCCSSSSGRTASPSRRLEGLSLPARSRSTQSCMSMEEPRPAMLLLWDQLLPLHTLGTSLPYQFSPRSGLGHGPGDSCQPPGWPQGL